MQTLLLNIDDILADKIMELLKSYPNKYKVRSINIDIDDDLDIIEDKIAYSNALEDLNNGSAINLDYYIRNRGI